jgi:hypothetical protein
MAVEDLVHESSAHDIGQSDVQRERRVAEWRQRELDDLPPPRLARFIKTFERIGDKNVAPPSLNPSSSTTSATLTTSSRSQDTKLTSVDSLSRKAGSSQLLRKSPLRIPPLLELQEDPKLTKSLIEHSYPPMSSGSFGTGVLLKSPASYSHYPRHHSNNKPIAATLLFGRNTHPLSLPKLDQYFSSLRPPPFFLKQVDGKGIMFPPLDQLERTGLSLDDLVSNTKVPPLWRDRTSILWTVASFLIDLLVCFVPILGLWISLSLKGFKCSGVVLQSSGLHQYVTDIRPDSEYDRYVYTISPQRMVLMLYIAPSENVDTKNSWRQLLLGTV